MAQISISLKYYEDAIPLLEQSLQIAPGRSDIRAALGESYFKSGKFDKSIEEIEKLIEIDAIQHFRAALQASLDRTT